MSGHPPADRQESLQAKLDATRKGSLEKMPAEVLDTFTKANQQVLEAGVEGRAVKEGRQAPDFSLPNVHGQKITLSALLRQGPVVLAFYRGGW
jgi:hypothetical protein